MQITCPSGMVIEARKLKGREIETLAAAIERKSAHDGVAQILAATWESTSIAGPYKYGTGAMDWRFVADGDVLKALIEHRKALRGPQYDFSAQCEKCGHRNELTVHLDELVMQPFPESSIERLRAGLPLETELPDGRKITYGFACIERANYLNEQLKQLKRRPDWAGHKPTWIDGLAARIKTIEGLEQSNQFVKRLELLLDFDADYLYPVKEAVDKSDCGIDTGVEFICGECRWEQRDDFPLGAAFFNPKTRQELKREEARKAPKEILDTETSETAPN